MIQHPAEYAGLGNFVWFFGVVEDNVDPLYLGRVRVRCFGWHDANKGQVPTSALPWAQIMMPSTSASVSGVGTSPTGIMTGSWVVGFFLDGDRCQQPMVLGSFHGIPQAMATTNQGFNDPAGQFPRKADDPDTTVLARTKETAETHKSTVWKVRSQVIGVNTAKRCKVEGGDAKADLSVGTWDEPKPRNSTSWYPNNKVTETEQGHVFETDDTPDGLRIHEYHASGTFREIQNDGTRITKIRTNDYEIVVGSKNIYVVGDCNVTVKGTVRLRVDGDLVEEVLGDSYLTVYGDRYTKIVGNDVKEVLGTENRQINMNSNYRVQGNRNYMIAGTESTNINKARTISLGDDLTTNIKGKDSTTAGSITTLSTGDLSITSGLSTTIMAGTNLKLKNLTSIDSSGSIGITAPLGALTISTLGAASITSSSIVTIVGSIVSINP